MRSLGSLMMFLGGFAAILSLLNRVPSLLFWIYNWGETTAWLIMIGLIVVGAGLYFLDPSQSEDE